MNRLPALARHLLLCAAIALPLAARADPASRDLFFDGAGSLVFDASSGVGAWLGTIDESTFPVVAAPLSLLSYVSFTFDSLGGHLQGSFEITDAADLGTTLGGVISGDLLQGDFANGGQLALDLDITGGSGQFAGASGFGISLLGFGAPVAGFIDYTENGVISFAVPVPEPAGAALLAAGLAGLAWLRRRRGQTINSAA